MSVCKDRFVLDHAVIRPAVRAALGIAGPLWMLIIASVPLASVAAASEPTARSGLEEIIVTARRREESAQSVPISVSVLDADALAHYNVEKLTDLQKVVPAMSANDGTGRRNAPSYALRGVRPTESLYGQDPTVAPYFAEIVLSPAEGSNLALYDLQSVQVLKGPQGTLFGRNTNGGALLFTPTRPGDELGGEVTLGYGRFNQMESEFGIDLPVSDTFRTRLSGRSFDRDGHQKNVTTGADLGGEQARSGRLSALWDITESIENYTIVSYDRARNEGRAAVIEAVRGPSATEPLGSPAFRLGAGASLTRQQARSIDAVEANFPQYEHVDAWAAFNSTTVELSDHLTLKNLMGYRYVKYESSYDQDATAVPRLLESVQPANLHHWSEEVQLLGTAFDDRFNWVTGLYYYHEDGRQTAAAFAAGGAQVAGGSVDSDSYSMFAQGTYRFLPAWALTVGGRYTIDEKEVDVENRTATQCSMFDRSGVRLPLSNCHRIESESFSAPTGTVSLEFTPIEDVLVYAASRRGYRAGGFNMRAVRNAEFEPFDEETVTDLELGAKVDWTLGSWEFRTNVALFQQWYDDIQRAVAEFVPGEGISTVIQNAAQAEIKGAEVEATIAPTSYLSLRLSYAYLDPQYQEWEAVSTTNPNVVLDLSKTPFAYIPEHAGSAALLLDIPIGDSAGTLEFQLSYSARSGVYINAFGTADQIRSLPGDVFDTVYQESFDLVDINLTWASAMGSNLDVTAYVKNATDERYAVGSISQYGNAPGVGGTPSASGLGLNTKVYSDPRMYGAQVSYRF